MVEGFGAGLRADSEGLDSRVDVQGSRFVCRVEGYVPHRRAARLPRPCRTLQIKTWRFNFAPFSFPDKSGLATCFASLTSHPQRPLLLNHGSVGVCASSQSSATASTLPYPAPRPVLLDLDPYSFKVFGRRLISV